jgi:hypothetical protein
MESHRGRTRRPAPGSMTAHRADPERPWGPVVVVDCSCGLSFFGRDSSEAHRLYARHHLEHSGYATYMTVA